MKKSLLSLLMIVGMLFIACGNEPPEEFYSGTPEDSTAIQTLLDNNPELQVGTDMFDTSLIAITLDNVGFVVSDSYFRVDSTIIKQHVDMCGFKDIERNLNYDFWFAKDTTCTVYLYDTFDVYSYMHWDERRTGYYFWQGDTEPDLDTVFIDSTGDNDSLAMTGNGKRIIFFDYDGTDWDLKRISYGTYNFPAAGTDVPSIQEVKLICDNGDRDSIIQSTYDTLYTGHVMNRFRAVDSLLVIDYANLTSDSLITIQTILGFGTVTDTMVQWFASIGGENRVYLPRVTGGAFGALKITGSGITNLYIECVVQGGYYYVQPRGEYEAQVWLVPVRIQ
ncbi:MAG: hypothetical protein WBB37_01870 [bacterium]